MKISTMFLRNLRKFENLRYFDIILYFSVQYKIAEFLEKTINDGKFWTTVARKQRHFEKKTATMRTCLTKLS